MDCASSEFYHDGIYDYTKFEGEKGKKRTADEQIDYLEELINKYPIDSIEDGMSENDWDGWKKLTYWFKPQQRGFVQGVTGTE